MKVLFLLNITLTLYLAFFFVRFLFALSWLCASTTQRWFCSSLYADVEIFSALFFKKNLQHKGRDNRAFKPVRASKAGRLKLGSNSRADGPVNDQSKKNRPRQAP